MGPSSEALPFICNSVLIIQFSYNIQTSSTQCSSQMPSSCLQEILLAGHTDLGHTGLYSLQGIKHTSDLDHCPAQRLIGCMLWLGALTLWDSLDSMYNLAQ